MATSPNNMFVSLWENAISGLNRMHPTHVKWDQVPNRNEEFKNDTIKMIGKDQWDLEYESKIPAN